jgi:acetyl-CoA carboxylase carboxyl transferase subunit alpha
MKLAEKFNKPIVTLIDTPGAYPGLEAEERGQGEAIARNIYELLSLKVPVICVIIGEGASGGALGIGVADRVLILENAYYSVISPEGCASILWKDRAYADKAAENLRMTAPDLIGLGICDDVVAEPLGGAHQDPAFTAKNLGDALERHLQQLEAMTIPERLQDRYDKFRRIGVFAA